MRKFIIGYAAGVVSTPIVCYVFRNQLFDHVVMPVAMMTVMGEDKNEKVFTIMSLRLEFQDFQKEHGKEIRQLKAQGYSVAQIAKKFDAKEGVIRGILRNTKEEK